MSAEKRLRRLLALLWIVAELVPVPLVANAISYDTSNRAVHAYDGPGNASLVYDAATRPPDNRQQKRPQGEWHTFCRFANLLAAESGAPSFVEQGRNALGQFISKVGGEVAPGSTAVSDFIENATQNGWTHVDTEVSFQTPFGLRRYDAVLTIPMV